VTSERTTVVDEQRQSTRFAKEIGAQSAAIFAPAELEMIVAVADESLSGLGLWVEDATRFRCGQELGIVYCDNALHATVRHVGPHPDGGFIVGLEC
jgi:hypothetical protein